MVSLLRRRHNNCRPRRMPWRATTDGCRSRGAGTRSSASIKACLCRGSLSHRGTLTGASVYLFCITKPRSTLYPGADFGKGQGSHGRSSGKESPLASPLALLAFRQSGRPGRRPPCFMPVRRRRLFHVGQSRRLRRLPRQRHQRLSLKVRLSSLGEPVCRRGRAVTEKPITAKPPISRVFSPAPAPFPEKQARDSSQVFANQLLARKTADAIVWSKRSEALDGVFWTS